VLTGLSYSQTNIRAHGSLTEARLVLNGLTPHF